MKLKPIHPASPHWPAAAALYVAAFPEIERRSPEAWAACCEREDALTVYGIFDDEVFCGFVCVWAFGDFTYMEHFAVLPERRGGGLGRQTVREIVRRSAPRPVVLEVEPPEDDLTRRRISFYERNGLAISDMSYLQPPYREGDDHLPLRLMTSSAAYLKANGAHVVSTIHRRVYGVAEV